MRTNIWHISVICTSIKQMEYAMSTSRRRSGRARQNKSKSCSPKYTMEMGREVMGTGGNKKGKEHGKRKEGGNSKDGTGGDWKQNRRSWKKAFGQIGEMKSN